MMNLTDEQLKKIENSVTEAEKTTSGEIVPVILKVSDLYPAAHFRAALVMGILFAFASYLVGPDEDPLYYLWMQVPGMIAGYLVAYLPVIKRLFTTKREMTEETYQKALEIYFENGVSMTRDRTGILIFLSLLERKVLVLADAGINEKVAKNHWDELVGKLLGRIKKGQLVEGLCDAIKVCGEDLSQNFPIKADDTNELSNKVITE